MTSRWQKDAQALMQSLIFKELSERELQLWNYLRMALDEVDHLQKEKRWEPEWGENTYGDGY